MRKAVIRITGVVFAGQALFAMANNAQGVLLTNFIDAFHLESAWQGLPNAAANIGVLSAMLLAVPIASRVGKPALYAAGMGLMGLMLALAGAAPSAFFLVTAYLLTGFAFGCIDTTSSSIIADIHEGRRASMLMGLLHAVYGAGGMLAPILMTAALAGGASWRAVLWALAAAAGAVCILCAKVFSRAREALPQAASAPARMTREDIAVFARQPGNLPIVLCAMFFCAHQCCVYLWISRIIGIGYNAPEMGAAALSLFWVGTVLSRLLVPALRLPALWYMRVGMLLCAAVLAAGAALGGAVVLCGAAGLAGLLGGAMIPVTLTEINRRNRSRSMLSITAVLLTTALSAILCAPLVGFVVARTSLAAGLVVSAVFALGSGAAAFGIGRGDTSPLQRTV